MGSEPPLPAPIREALGKGAYCHPQGWILPGPCCSALPLPGGVDGWGGPTMPPTACPPQLFLPMVPRVCCVQPLQQPREIRLQGAL